MKNLKLLTLAASISVALTACNSDSINFQLRLPTTDDPLINIDEVEITAIDGYLQKATLYPLDADGVCDTDAEPLGVTGKGGKVNAKKAKLKQGYCVVAKANVTIDEDKENATIEVDFALESPEPATLDVDWEKNGISITPFTNYLKLAIDSGEDSKEAKINLAKDLGFYDLDEKMLSMVLFGDFIKAASNPDFDDEIKIIARKSRGFARLLVKVAQGNDRISYSMIRNIAKIARDNKDPDFLIKLADVKDEKTLIGFTAFINVNINIIIDADPDNAEDTSLKDLTDQSNNVDFSQTPELDYKIADFTKVFTVALGKALTSEASNKNQLNLGELVFENIKFENADLEADSRIVLTQRFATLGDQETKELAGSYDAGTQSFTLTDELIITQAGNYEFELYIEKNGETSDQRYRSNSVKLLLSINATDNFVPNTAPVYAGDHSAQASEIMAKFSQALEENETIFASTENGTTLSFKVEELDFNQIFSDREQESLEFIISENAEDFKDNAGSGESISYQDGIFSVNIDLPADLNEQGKEYRIAVRAKDAQGLESRQAFTLSIQVTKDADGIHGATAKFDSIEVNKPEGNITLNDLEIAVPVTKAHEKALEETLETLLSGKTLSANYSLNELLPISGYLCEGNETKKEQCERQNIVFAGDYKLEDVAGSDGTVHDILSIIKTTNFESYFALLNAPQAKQNYTWYLDTTIFDANSNFPIPVKYYEHDELDSQGNIKDFADHKNYLRLEIETEEDDGEIEIKVDVKFDTERKDTAAQPTTPYLAYDFEFPQGLLSYQAGTRVLHDGSVYECKPFPNSGYCTQWSAGSNQYEPGVGDAWEMAWSLLGELGDLETESGNSNIDPEFSNPALPLVDYHFAYPESEELYKLGTLVAKTSETDSVTYSYECLSPKGCANTSNTEYQPETGSNWQAIWLKVGKAGTLITDPEFSNPALPLVDYHFAYPESEELYKLGTLVAKTSETDSVTYSYECLSPKGCANTSNTEYQPETGSNWQAIWLKVGKAGNQMDAEEAPAIVDYNYLYPENIAEYKMNTIVAGNDGFAYQCISGKGCATEDSLYEPGVGEDWKVVWQQLGTAGDQIVIDQ